MEHLHERACSIMRDSKGDRRLVAAGGFAVHIIEHDETRLVVGRVLYTARENFSDFAGTALGEQLRRKGITRLFVGGLALDYCVRATVLEGLTEGFEVHLLLSATRAVDVKEGDGQRAIDEMRAAGARIEDGAA